MAAAGSCHEDGSGPGGLCCILQCSTRSPSFQPVARHPDFSHRSFELLQLQIERNPLKWTGPLRARVIGYDGSELVAASVLGPIFDAEKDPAGVRPLFLADGYLDDRAIHGMALPSDQASIYVRLFRIETESVNTGIEYGDNEFLAVHLRLDSAYLKGREEGSDPACEGTFWKLRNPVRQVVHCFLPSPAEIKELHLEVAANRQGKPTVRIRQFNLNISE